MILVYAEKITNRLRYAVELIFSEVLLCKVELTNNLEDYKIAKQPIKINYSTKENIGFSIYPSGLLFEHNIVNQNIKPIKKNGISYFFPAPENSQFPFDIFSASFYMVSRYEEYLPFETDKFNRFKAEESLAYKFGFLRKPVVNIWANWLKNELNKTVPNCNFPKRNFEFISTIDIDNAFAYKEKGVMRTLGGLGKSIWKGNFSEFGERLKVLAGNKQDPYDTFDYQLEIQKKYSLKTIYFFLLGNYGFNDKNISHNSRKLQQLIKSLADYAQIGIHPSFGSNTNPDNLKIEIERLSTISKREITKSRQHFLMLQLPETYRRLIDLDITDDYTMGFASQVGFRAGICTTYSHYDLDLDTKTKLKIHPFAVMDGTLKDYNKLNTDEAILIYNQIIDEIKTVNGSFISLWHNESLTNKSRWKGWRKVYEKMITKALE